MFVESAITLVPFGCSGYIYAVCSGSVVVTAYDFESRLTVVKTVGGADGADDRRGRRLACRRCHVL